MPKNPLFAEDADNDQDEPQLAVVVNSTEESYQVVFFEDGSGHFVDDGCEEEFRHSLNFTELHTLHPTQTDLEDYLVSYFWQEINPKLADPLLKDYSDLEGHELEFVTGSSQEFDHLMQLFLLTEPNLDKTVYNSVMVRCGTHRMSGETTNEMVSDEDEDTEPYLENWHYWSERLSSLVEMALKEHRPYGYTYEYNDQSGDRHSGYSLTPDCLVYELTEYIKAPARECTNARRELREWLVVRGEDPALFQVDGWEKIV